MPKFVNNIKMYSTRKSCVFLCVFIDGCRNGVVGAK